MMEKSKIRAIHRRPDDLYTLIIVLIIFLISATLAATTEISQFEKNLFYLINGINFNLGLPLTIIMYSGTIFGVLAISIIIFLLRKKRLSFDMLLAGSLAWGLAHIFKIIIARQRPVNLLEPIIRETTTLGLSFPSGHTAVITALTVILTPYLKKNYRKFAWLFVLFIAIGRIYVGAHFPTDVIGGYFLGLFTGLAIRLIRGTKGYSPSKKTIKESLKKIGMHVSSIELIESDSRFSIPFIIKTKDSKEYFLKISSQESFTKDKLKNKLYAVFYSNLHKSNQFTTNQQKIEHEAYMAILAKRAGVNVPDTLTTLRLDDGGIALVQEKINGKSLDRLDKKYITKDTAKKVLEQVRLLRNARIAHRDLNLANLILDENKKIWISDLGLAQASATEQLINTDLAESLVALSSVIGINKTIEVAHETISKENLSKSVPFIQGVGLASRTREEANASSLTLITDLRLALAKSLNMTEIQKARITRFSIKNIFILMVLFFSIHILLPKIEGYSKTIGVMKGASWTLLALATIIQIISFIFDSLALQALTTKKLKLLQTYLVQVAGTFINAFSFVGVGVALSNRRYLTKKGQSKESATSVATILLIEKYIMRISIFIMLVFLLRAVKFNLTLNMTKELSILLWALMALILLGIVITIFYPRYVREKYFGPLKNLINKSIKDIKELYKTKPKSFIKMLLWQFLSIISDVATLYICLLSFHATGPNFLAVFAVVVAGNLISSISPTPGGLGAMEASFILGLTTAGIPAAIATASTIAYRLLTFWLPIIPGAMAYKYIKKKGSFV